MTQPTNVFSPLQAGVPAAGGELDVLVRVQAADRPANLTATHLLKRLALVVDRSGSMNGPTTARGSALRDTQYQPPDAARRYGVGGVRRQGGHAAAFAAHAFGRCGGQVNSWCASRRHDKPSWRLAGRCPATGGRNRADGVAGDFVVRWSSQPWRNRFVGHRGAMPRVVAPGREHHHSGFGAGLQ